MWFWWYIHTKYFSFGIRTLCGLNSSIVAATLGSRWGYWAMELTWWGGTEEMKWYEIPTTYKLHSYNWPFMSKSGQGKCPICRRGEQKNDPIYLDNLFCRFVLICQLRKYATLDNVQILLLEPIMNQMLHIAMGWNPSSSFIHISSHQQEIFIKKLNYTKVWKLKEISC